MNESNGLLLLGRSVVFRPLLVLRGGPAGCAEQAGCRDERL